jgi:CheY-like chemotaxis protein
VTNLLTNALKFTPRGGRVDVRCHRDGGDMVVTLRDTGAGIAAEFLPHIFDRFTQADGSRPAVGGLGLGLSIVRQIMDVHGGTVHAESAGLGQGATFTLRIPLAPPGESQSGAPHADPSSVAAPPCTLAGLSILVVDDDADTRESLALLLAGRGAAVRRAAAAAEALEQCVQAAPDVIISDISMPEQDGYAFVEALRSRGGQQHQPLVIALTGFAADSDRARAATAGFDAHLPKPVDLERLAQTILNLMEYGPGSGNDPQFARAR